MNTNLKSQLRLILLATVAAGALAVGGTAVAADATAAPSTLASTGTRDGSIIERIKHLHDMLKITPAQEAQWTGVAQVMQDNAMSMESAIKDRETKGKDMSAVDDILSFQAVTEAHAAGLKKFADAFSPLYAAMSPEQQKNADTVFRRRTESAAAHTHMHG
jgi:Spy/CpxP family protein refolding chaperone